MHFFRSQVGTGSVEQDLVGSYLLLVMSLKRSRTSFPLSGCVVNWKFFSCFFQLLMNQFKLFQEKVQEKNYDRESVWFLVMAVCGLGTQIEACWIYGTILFLQMAFFDESLQKDLMASSARQPNMLRWCACICPCTASCDLRICTLRRRRFSLTWRISSV